MNPIIILKEVNKTFLAEKKRRIEALKDISLEINEGELFIFLGPSGCGKSTLLRIIAGLEKSSHGEINFSSDLSYDDISFVFQQFAVLPWLTVYENVELGLIERNLPQQERERKVAEELKRFKLEKFSLAYPKELSGGMKQRVGLARAFVTNPKIILMDEPFSELDSFTSRDLRKELLSIWSIQKPTIVMVTHNLAEAVELADRVGVLSSRPGIIKKVVEIDLPRPRHLRSEGFYKFEDELDSLIRL
jgi:ABC-type nitrate/sulfonate/bicarbonate transport system ATPase subunit